MRWNGLFSLRWKLIVMSVVIVFIPVFFLNRYALSFFDRFTCTELEKHLRHYAYIAGEQCREELASGDADPGSTAPFLERMGREIGADLQVLDRSGRVVRASAPSLYAAIPEGRSEIAESLAGGYSARYRLSDDRQLMRFYVARPVKDDDKNLLGVVYVTTDTRPIMQAINRMVANQRMATYLALLLAGAVATVLALTMTRRLRGLMRQAQAYADGRPPGGAPPAGGDEIAQLGRAVHRMAAEIEARHVYNRDFIQTALHELKTPLTAIRGAAEVLEGEAAEQPADRARFVNIIATQVRRMMRLTGELRELTRVEAESLQTARQTLDFTEFMQGALTRLGETFPEPRARLTWELPSGPVPVAIVPGRMEQVFANLLDNAFRYTPETGRVHVWVERTGGIIRIRVEDTGCGIAPAHLVRVFDRFFTTERPQQPQDYGSGLGLAIASDIVRAHQGIIRAESPSGGGACFVIELPVSVM